MSHLDTQISGTHYRKYTIQPTEFFYKNNIPFIEANIIKYTLRHREKNGLEDLLKAKHYLDILIELEYTNHESKEKPSNRKSKPRAKGVTRNQHA
jgi:hypothetical protein